MDEDHDLVQRCLRKEPQAEYQFYRQLEARMFGVCLRYSRNHMEAEDMLQEGFFRVFNKLHTFRFEGSLEGWVRRVIIGSAINFMKNQLRYPVEVDLENALDHATFPDDTLSKLTEEVLLGILNGLAPGYRTVFNLAAIDGYSHKEIGEMLCISEETSKSQLFRAKLKIRKIFEQIEAFGLQ
jgi:RNA polymerase sigma factor (sigma-70 family)